MSKTKARYETVTSAIDSLVRGGEPVSVRRVQAVLGGGDPATISRLIKEIQGAPSAAPLPSPAAIPSSPVPTGLCAECANLRQQLTELEAQLSGAQASSAIHQQTNTDLQLILAQHERTISELRQQLETAQQLVNGGDLIAQMEQLRQVKRATVAAKDEALAESGAPITRPARKAAEVKPGRESPRTYHIGVSYDSETPIERARRATLREALDCGLVRSDEMDTFRQTAQNVVDYKADLYISALTNRLQQYKAREGANLQ